MSKYTHSRERVYVKMSRRFSDSPQTPGEILDCCARLESAGQLRSLWDELLGDEPEPAVSSSALVCLLHGTTQHARREEREKRKNSISAMMQEMAKKFEDAIDISRFNPRDISMYLFSYANKGDLIPAGSATKIFVRVRELLKNQHLDAKKAMMIAGGMARHGIILPADIRKSFETLLARKEPDNRTITNALYYYATTGERPSVDVVKTILEHTLPKAKKDNAAQDIWALAVLSFLYDDLRPEFSDIARSLNNRIIQSYGDWYGHKLRQIKIARSFFGIKDKLSGNPDLRPLSNVENDWTDFLSETFGRAASITRTENIASFVWRPTMSFSQPDAPKTVLNIESLMQFVCKVTTCENGISRYEVTCHKGGYLLKLALAAREMEDNQERLAVLSDHDALAVMFQNKPDSDSAYARALLDLAAEEHPAGRPYQLTLDETRGGLTIAPLMWNGKPVGFSNDSVTQPLPGLRHDP